MPPLKNSVKLIDNWRERFPGGQLVWQGLEDFQAGRCTIPACLIGIGRTRFIRAGLLAASAASPCPEPERVLYRLLRAADGDAYSRYNSLLRELISFEQALDRAR